MLLEERHPTGGLDPDAATEAMSAPHGPMSGQGVELHLRQGLTVLTELDPTHQAFLYDHRIDGTPVLPGVMGMEGFAEAAPALLPGWRVERARGRRAAGSVQVLPRRAAHARAAGAAARRRRRHARGGLSPHRPPYPARRASRRPCTSPAARASPRELPAPPDADEAPAEGSTALGVGSEAIYRVYFHGPAYQVLERAWRHDGTVIGRLAADLPPDHEPAGQPTEIAPRLIELCFQTAGVWELGHEGRMGLPTHVDRITRFDGADDGGTLFAVVSPRDDGRRSTPRWSTSRATVRVLLEGYRTIELPGGLDAEALEPIRSAMS